MPYIFLEAIGIVALALLCYIVYKGVVKLYDWVKFIFFPTQHELEMRLEATLKREEELETKQELKEDLINATKRVKILEKADAKMDAELNKVCESKADLERTERLKKYPCSVLLDPGPKKQVGGGLI